MALPQNMIGNAANLYLAERFPPSTSQVLAAGTQIAPNGNVLPISAASAITLTATPTIAAGWDGQEITIINVGTFAITFQDKGTLANSGLALLAKAIKVVGSQALKLIYSTTLSSWVQIQANTDYITRRLCHTSANASVTINVNSTSYVDLANDVHFEIDLDAFLPTHFRITGQMQSNAALATITLQAAIVGAPTVPVHTGGDDLVVSNSLTFYDSDWRTWDTPTTGFQICMLAFKGSTATVDFVYQHMDLQFKR